MKPLNECDLERLLRDETGGDALVPPADLADRIKAEIPADLGWADATPPAVESSSTDDTTTDATKTDTSTNVVAGPWSRQRTWAVAASLVTLVGAGLLAQRLFVDSTPQSAVSDFHVERSGESESSAPQAATVAPGVEPQEIQGSFDTDPGVVSPGTAVPGNVPQEDPSRNLQDSSSSADAPARPAVNLGLTHKSSEASRQDFVGGPEADDVLMDLEASDPVTLDSMTVTPSLNPDTTGDGTPRDHRAGRLRAEDLAAETQLRALGYVGGEVAEVVAEPEPVAESASSPARRRPRPPAAPSPPPSAPPSPPPSPPAIAAQVVPKPQVREASRRRLEERVAANAPVERQLSEVEALDFDGGAAPSTGGTAEPNDAPVGDMFFRSEDTNPFLDTEDDRLSTFGFDVDTASYTLSRRYLHDGHLPDPDGVRVEEFVNYFDYGDTPPEEGDFALHAEGAPSPFGEGDRYYLLRLNAHGRVLDASQRAPAQLTFVVDISGSMDQQNRLGLVKQALGLLIDQLRPDDRVALVVYGGSGRVLLEPTADHDAIRRALGQLRPEGSTNAEEGLRLAYQLAAQHRQTGRINRVILCSDGVANVGRTSAESILERIRLHAEQGIELTTVGFGMGNYNDVLMEQLANQGNGRYAYVDTLDEAHRIFVEDLTGTLQTLAAEARAQVEFDPKLVERYRLLGYENRDIADERFRDDTVDAGEIGMGHRVTALYELKLRRTPRRRDHLATLRLRYASVAAGEMVELERTVTGADFVGQWERTSTGFRLTSLVAEFAEILRRSYWARDGDLDEVFRRTQRLSGELAGDQEVAELVALMGRAAEIQRRAPRSRR